MCAAAGGVAAIIYNNVPGPFHSTLNSATSTCNATGTSITSLALPQELAGNFADDANITAATMIPKYLYEAWSG